MFKFFLLFFFNFLSSLLDPVVLESITIFWSSRQSKVYPICNGYIQSSSSRICLSGRYEWYSEVPDSQRWSLYRQTSHCTYMVSQLISYKYFDRIFYFYYVILSNDLLFFIQKWGITWSCLGSSKTKMINSHKSWFQGSSWNKFGGSVVVQASFWKFITSSVFI